VETKAIGCYKILVLKAYNIGGFAMTECISLNYQFSRVKNHKLEVNFNGGDISSDGGFGAERS
jgi:hypothetical protein